MLKKINAILRPDEIIALLFFSVAACVSWVYGYPLRYYILTDLIYHYLLVFPIFLIFLFHFHIKSPYLKLGWTILALGLVVFLVVTIIRVDVHFFFDDIALTAIWRLTIFLWSVALAMHLLKRPQGSGPLLSNLKKKALILSLLAFLRSWWPIFVVLFAYCTLKSIIPVINPRLYDEQFNTMDYFLFLKHSPTELALTWIPLSCIGFLSFGYKFYFLLKISALSSIYCVVRDRRIFHRLVIAFSLTYIFGLGIYLVVPAQGPIYYFPEAFQRIEAPMSETSTYLLQRTLWTVYEQVKQHTPMEFYELTTESGIRNGIAAFPSLHIAISCVLLYFLYRYHRVTFWLCFFPFWLMVLATIYFGWHYVVDNIAGFVLAALVLCITNRGANNNGP